MVDLSSQVPALGLLPRVERAQPLWLPPRVRDGQDPRVLPVDQYVGQLQVFGPPRDAREVSHFLPYLRSALLLAWEVNE